MVNLFVIIKHAWFEHTKICFRVLETPLHHLPEKNKSMNAHSKQRNITCTRRRISQSIFLGFSFLFELYLDDLSLTLMHILRIELNTLSMVDTRMLLISWLFLVWTSYSMLNTYLLFYLCKLKDKWSDEKFDNTSK